METNTMTVEQLQAALALANGSKSDRIPLTETGWNEIAETGMSFSGLKNESYNKDNLSEQAIKSTSKKHLPYVTLDKLGKKFDVMLGTFKKYLPKEALVGNYLPLSFQIFTNEVGQIDTITF